jgi:hypothetical protein
LRWINARSIRLADNAGNVRRYVRARTGHRLRRGWGHNGREERDMRDILDGLKRDHGNFAMLLKAFERELKVFDTGARPDYELIEDILR